MERIMQMAPPADFSAILRERTDVLLRLRQQKLNLDWVHTYPLPQLSACCDRLKEVLSGKAPIPDIVQAELIENQAFAAYYGKLLKRFPEEPGPMSKSGSEARQSGTGGLPRYDPPKPRGRRAILADRFTTLLENCREAEIDMTAFPQADIMETLELDVLLDGCRLVYLYQFAPMKLSEEEQRMATKALNNCVSVPLELNDVQRAILRKPFVGSCELFASASFADACALLTDHPDLEMIAQFLYEMGIRECLGLDQYRQFSENAPEYRRRIISVFGHLEQDAANAVMGFWQRSGYPLRELQIMERHLAGDMPADLDAVFTSYAGYVNLLYGTKLKGLDFAQTNARQEAILLYAIVNNKKHFIRLVNDDPEMFLALPSNSILLMEELYWDHINLNELTQWDLADCAWMVRRRLDEQFLTPGRVYTFTELRVLYNAHDVYASLYNRLTAERQDDRLLIIRQLIKRGLLQGSPSDSELDALANCLNIKPLDRWMHQEFAKIDGLTASVAVQLLIHLDTVRHLLPSFRNQTDVVLALRNLENISLVNTTSELRSRIAEIDHDWAALSKEMALTNEFRTQNEDRIVRFLCRNGAYIANRYLSSLEESQQKAFLRVVKAELMGQLSKLKYYDGDLQRELDHPLSEYTIEQWKEHTGVSIGGVEVKEYDDFFSTMLLGVQPHRTCLSYIDGAYRACLLSGFNSNKKVLYAKKDGKIIGRAFLRLTKGRPTDAAKDKKNSFTFVDLEHIGDTREEGRQSDERLVLFLERPYTSGTDAETAHVVKDALITLACRKAETLNAVTVLSREYHGARTQGFAYTTFHIYISRSKAGTQYLDSLDGEG